MDKWTRKYIFGDWFTGGLIEWLSDWLTDEVTDWLTKWLTDKVTNHATDGLCYYKNKRIMGGNMNEWMNEWTDQYIFGNEKVDKWKGFIYMISSFYQK